MPPQRHAVREPERAGRFYSGLFQWTEHEIGGIPPAKERNPQIPPHWLVYFHVTNCDESVAKAKQLGATAMGPAISMEDVGRWAVLADPQGATFAIFEPAPHG
ncbi:MAG: VOC family protein [Acidobacteria bacterium]|nr:VOC family protein [Acidobacteriota bacterium]